MTENPFVKVMPLAEYQALLSRIAELEKELDDLRQYLHTGEMPKENERWPVTTD